MSRDNARTPIQWSAETNAGFTTGEPWIAVNPNHTLINAEAQVGEPRSVFSFYRALIELRHRERVVSHGSFELVLRDHPTVFAYTRRLGDRQLLVIVNLSSEPTAYDLLEADEWSDAEPVLGNRDGHPRLDGRLAPWEAQVFCLTRQE
jgi:oligo-1,6-glucosidase